MAKGRNKKAQSTKHKSKQTVQDKNKAKNQDNEVDEVIRPSWIVGDKIYIADEKNVFLITDRKHPYVTNLYGKIDDTINSDNEPMFEKFKRALEKGIVSHLQNCDGVKPLGKYKYELKISEDVRLIHKVIYVTKDQDNPQILVIFTKKANHNDLTKQYSDSVQHVLVDSYITKASDPTSNASAQKSSVKNLNNDFHHAVRYNSVDEVKKLLDAGAAITNYDGYHNFLLDSSGKEPNLFDDVIFDHVT